MSIKEKALQNALSVLDALKCGYKVITTDGQEYGELAVVMPKKRHRSKYPLGTYANYVRPFIDGLTVGDVSVIPLGEFDGKDLQSSVTIHAHHKWGKGSYKTCVTDKAVEILRII